ncbi:VOC family protein [Flavihumibacter petaseus]|nr:VOC family protein [Flavihumibacter petaseus]
MSTHISAYINFNGKCREAMTFYQQSLGGTLEFQTVAESPVAGQMPPSMKDQIVHSTLTSGDLKIMASDLTRGPFATGNNITLAVHCSSEEEIRRFFNNLSQGGEIADQLQVMFWGDLFGSLVDKFGIPWLFNLPLKK